MNAGTAYTTNWTYNSADMPITMKYPDNETVTYNYNSRMMLDSVIGTSTYVSATGYDSAGRMTSRALGNGVNQNYTYYPWSTSAQGGRLQYLKSGTTGAPTSLQNMTYTYDAVGNVTNIMNTNASETNVYDYDTLNRLWRWTLNGTPTPETYGYDSASGNLATKANVTLSYNDAAHKHAVSSAGSNTYSYDANGNQTTRVIGGQTFNLSYDAENRLVSVSGAATASFVYDGDGRQVKAVVGSTTTYYIGAHYQIDNGVITKYYFAGAQRVAMRSGSTLYYLLGDHLGSTSITTNSSGTLVSELRYKPWGETRYSSGTMPTNYQFTGQRNEVSIGLYFYNARWYDSSTGRFAQADIIVPGGVQGLDRYSYGLNNPSRYTDPSGHKACEYTGENGNCYRVVLYLVCGFGTNGNCAKNKSVDGYGGIPLGLFAKWAREEGYGVKYFDFNGDDKSGAKLRMADSIVDYMRGHSSDLPMIVGHSAGADASILAVNKMTADQRGKIGGVVLLDPTLTAGPDYGNPGDLTTFAMDIPKSGIPLIIADGIGTGSDEDSGVLTTPYINPNTNPEFQNYVKQGLYSYTSYEGMNHYLLATNLAAFQNSISALMP